MPDLRLLEKSIKPVQTADHIFDSGCLVLAPVSDRRVIYLAVGAIHLRAEVVPVIEAPELDDDRLVDHLEARDIKVLQHPLQHSVLGLCYSEPYVSLAVDVVGVVDIIFYAGAQISPQSENKLTGVFRLRGVQIEEVFDVEGKPILEADDDVGLIVLCALDGNVQNTPAKQPLRLLFGEAEGRKSLSLFQQISHGLHLDFLFYSDRINIMLKIKSDAARVRAIAACMSLKARGTSAVSGSLPSSTRT
ncbi:Uncharacterised protein [uncultured archaeon]|nr:Uncharacterised protein [uncultured archaeon]